MENAVVCFFCLGAQLQPQLLAGCAASSYSLGFSDKKLLTQKLPHHDFSSQPNPWSFPLMASPDPAHPPAGRADMSSAEEAGLRQNSPDLYLLCFYF